MNALTESGQIAGWTPAQLDRFVKGKLDGQPIGNITGLAAAIVNGRPLFTLDLIASPGPGKLRADGSAFDPATFPGLAERLSAAGWPYGVNLLPNMTADDFDADIGWFVQGS